MSRPTRLHTPTGALRTFHDELPTQTLRLGTATYAKTYAGLRCSYEIGVRATSCTSDLTIASHPRDPLRRASVI